MVLSASSSLISLNLNQSQQQSHHNPPIYECLEKLTEPAIYRSRLNTALSSREEELQESQYQSPQTVIMRRVGVFISNGVYSLIYDITRRSSRSFLLVLLYLQSNFLNPPVSSIFFNFMRPFYLILQTLPCFTLLSVAHYLQLLSFQLLPSVFLIFSGLIF